MSMPSEQHGHQGFLHSATGQLALLGIAIIAVLVVAWRYVW